jgi:hypothetical protein
MTEWRRHEPDADSSDVIDLRVPLPQTSHRLDPRWTAWVASLPLLCLLIVGVLLAARRSGSIEVIEAPAPTAVPPPMVGTTVPPLTPTSAPVTVVVRPRSTPVETSQVSTAPTSTSASPTGAASAPTSSSQGPTPRTSEDCRDDGWRHLVDAHDEPFLNQGQCLRFVASHASQHP